MTTLSEFLSYSYVGFTGSIGFTGSRGDIGYTGSRGNTGFAGSIGALGYTGSVGFTGSQGIIGFTGSKGVAGFLADVSSTPPATTTVGHMWFDTDDASLSVYYDDGTSQQWVTVTGERGVNGYSGSLGYTGSQGPIGYTGSQGVVGYTVSQGVVGYTGSQGNVGYTGSQGIGFTGSAGIINWLTKTANYTASTFDYILADTSAGSFTITLPATPITGDTVIILDKSNWTINNLNIARNGNTIEGFADDFILDVGQMRAEFTYDGTTWQFYSSIGPRGFTGSSGGAEAIAYSIALG